MHCFYLSCQIKYQAKWGIEQISVHIAALACVSVNRGKWRSDRWEELWVSFFNFWPELLHLSSSQHAPFLPSTGQGSAWPAHLRQTMAQLETNFHFFHSIFKADLCCSFQRVLSNCISNGWFTNVGEPAWSHGLCFLFPLTSEIPTTILKNNAHTV